MRNKEPVSKVIAQLEKDLDLAHKQSDMWYRMLMEFKNPGNQTFTWSEEE
jgi:hypothetical protein